MASPAPSLSGDDKPPGSAPGDLTSLDPPADPQRDGEPPAPPSAPAPSSGDDVTSAMGVAEIPGPARAECGAKRSRPAPCRACERRKMILRGVDPGPPSDDELSAVPAATWCRSCEFRKKLRLDMRLRRNSQVPAPPQGQAMPTPYLDYMPRHALEQNPPRARARARPRPQRGEKRPLSVEQERGYRECDVGKKVMRHRWDGLRHKWASPRPEILDSAPPGLPAFGATAGRRDVLEKMMLVAQKALRADDAKLALLREAQRLDEMPHVWAAMPWEDPAERRDLLEETMLFVQKALRMDDAKLAPTQGAQKLDGKWAGLPWDSAPQMAGFGASAAPRDALEKMMLDMRKALRAEDAKLPLPQEAQNLDGLHHMWAGMPWDAAPHMSGFGAAAGRRDLLHKPMLSVQKALRVDDPKLALPQGAQKPSSSAAARVDVLQEKLAQMTKVLTKVLHEGGVLQVSMKLMRVLCPDFGSSTASGGGLDGSDWVLVEEAIDNLVNQTGDGMQDIVKTVIPKVFSKENLYDLITACIGRYPKLLEDDRGKLTKNQYKQYQKQLDLMVDLTTIFDDDPENFSKIMKLMCKIGRCGPLPREVIDDISPGLDPSIMEQLYTEMLELLHKVDIASPVHSNPFSKWSIDEIVYL